MTPRVSIDDYTFRQLRENGELRVEDELHGVPFVQSAGSGGGRIETGRYLKVPSQPMSNLFLDLLEPLGVRGVKQFGDSDGRRVLV